MDPAEKNTDHSDYELHWLTELMHLASRQNLPESPEGDWSSPSACTEELLRNFSRMLSVHSRTPPAVLRWLADLEDIALLERLAEHPNLSLATMEALSCSPYPQVRAALAENQSLPFELMFKLAMDEHPDVRYRLSESYNLPQEIVAMLCVDENPYVAYRAQCSARKCRLPVLEQHLAACDIIRVLIVDDDDVTRLILALALKPDQKVKIIGQAASGADAVKLAAEHQPDIVLMDIGMPGMDGIEATARLKKLSPHSRVIMVTAHDTLEEIISAFGHGAEGYHLKSTPNHDLSKAIRVVSSGSFWLDPGIASMVLREFSQKSVSILQGICRNPQELANADFNNPVDLLLRSADEFAADKRLSEAMQICKSAVSLAEKLFGIEATCTNRALSKLADLHYLEEEYASSESAYLNLVTMQSKLVELDDPELDKYLLLLAEFYEFSQRYEQAELFYSWLLRIREKSANPEKIADASARLDRLLEKSGTLKSN